MHTSVPGSAVAAPRTVGRDGELASIGAYLDDAGAPLAGLLIEGDGGIGKSRLWQEAVRAAQQRGHRVLACRPAENEASIGFAGLIDLLGSLGDQIPADLPEAQRRAFDAALMRGSSRATAEPGAVAVSLVSVLRALARAQPTVIAIDDLHWLDAPTRSALGFALRRLSDERMAVVLTARTRSAAESLGISLTRLVVPPLSLGATYQLIHERLGVALARPALVRVHQASAGNPLFSLELTRAWIDRGGVSGADHLPVPERLSDLLRERLDDLPAQTREVLLLAAAMVNPTVHAVARAANRPVDEDIARAEKAGVVDSSDGIVRFTHPLMAAAVYDAATAAERRSTHRELADLAQDLEDRARHFALTSPEPDEKLATVLDRAASHVSRRGATTEAATFAQRALEFTPREDHAALYRRAMSAGTLWLAAGDRARARSFFERAVADAPSGPGRADALCCLAELSTPLGHGLARCDRALLDAGADAAVASRIHRTRGAIAYFLGDVTAAEHHAGLGVELAESSGDPQALGMAMAELAHWTYCGGGGVRHDLFARANALDGTAGASSPRSHLAKVVMDDDRHDEARELLTRLLGEAMETGDLHAASTHRFHLAELEVWAGNWLDAIGHAQESLQLRQHVDQPGAPLYVEAMARACLGQVDQARHLAQEGLAGARREEDVVFQMQNLHVLGFIDLSLGDAEAAHVLLGEATDLMRPRWNKEFGDCHVVPDEIEALVALGDLSRAEELTTWMTDVARATQRPWTLTASARSRAVVQAARNDLEAADAALEEALVAHERLPMPFELCRTLLMRGVVQRRMRRRAVARTTLEEARTGFERLGATLWVERAGSELARIGVRSEAQVDLTPVERRIAVLVAEGRTNREIAAKLSLSTKTVEANLSRSYRKMQVRSRAELVAKLATPVDPADAT